MVEVEGSASWDYRFRILEYRLGIKKRRWAKGKVPSVRIL